MLLLVFHESIFLVATNTTTVRTTIVYEPKTKRQKNQSTVSAMTSAAAEGLGPNLSVLPSWSRVSTGGGQPDPRKNSRAGSYCTEAKV